ncbi:FGGY-family carbohydrate kinase [Lichenicoccus sp.]|uniref:FGGY-family carbohydrate kinase n=1 Tax=Lichenicoccus sp. TaxID=2781899 RepID=UPI003D0D3191
MPDGLDDKVFIGVDIGGSVVKAAAFDARGFEVTCCSRRIASTHPMPGRNERDPEAMWQAAAAALRQVVAILPGGPGSVASLCCAGHGNGLYLLDERLQALGSGIVSSDTRASSLLSEFEMHPHAASVTRRRGQRFGIAEPSLLMTWMDRHEPDLVRRAAFLVMCKDYVRLRLTGRIETDLCDASGAALVNIADHGYDEENFHRLGLSHWLPKLPPLRLSTDLCGGVSAAAAAQTGLLEGTPVAAGMMDLEAVTLGSGVLDTAHLVMSAGTWNIDMQVTEHPCLDPLPLMQSLCRNGTRYLLAEGSPTGAANLSWLLGDILEMSDPHWPEINRLVSSLSAADSQLVHLPCINGSAGAEQGGFLGITGHVGRAHLLRAIYESNAFMHRFHAGQIRSVTGQPFACGRLSGGVTRSDVWSQMFADVLGLRIEVSDSTEIGALGCAVCAATAVGHHAELEIAVDAMTRVARSFEPDASVGRIYQQKYEVFLEMRKALRPHWGSFEQRVQPAAPA